MYAQPKTLCFSSHLLGRWRLVMKKYIWINLLGQIELMNSHCWIKHIMFDSVQSAVSYRLANTLHCIRVSFLIYFWFIFTVTCLHLHFGPDQENSFNHCQIMGLHLQQIWTQLQFNLLVAANWIESFFSLVNRPLLLLLHLFNGYCSRTTWVSCYQKGKTSLDLNEERHDGVLGCSGISWTIRKQSAPRFRRITTPTTHHSIFTGQMLFLMPNQQCQSTDGQKSPITSEGINRNVNESQPIVYLKLDSETDSQTSSWMWPFYGLKQVNLCQLVPPSQN